MEPRVAGADYGFLNIADEVNEIKEEVTAETLRAKRNLLLTAFGTQRSRLRMQRYERGIVKGEALGNSKEIHNLLLDASQNTSLMTNKEVLAQANAGVVRNIPPYDISATSPENAYPLDKIITQEDWSSLVVKELMKAARKQDAEEALRKEKGYSNFILNRLHKLRVEGDSKGNERRAHMMLYLQYLLSFFNIPQHVLARASDPWGATGMFQDAKAVDLGSLLGMPPTITAKLLKLFTENGKSTSENTFRRHRSHEHINLLISYILVLGLKIDSFEMDPYDLAVELKMTISQIRPHFLELGSKFETLKPTEKDTIDVNSNKMKYKVTLPVPLQFPKLIPSRQKRKR
ncbi:hypothetical protein O6H91_06G068500 [Diphasiastrum complanatum]|nr:hypothetical protein O6H91_06G068500 [Diphasiastrum complanatum]